MGCVQSKDSAADPVAAKYAHAAPMKEDKSNSPRKAEGTEIAAIKHEETVPSPRTAKSPKSSAKNPSCGAAPSKLRTDVQLGDVYKLGKTVGTGGERLSWHGDLTSHDSRNPLMSDKPPRTPS